jgi:hypothetical protein
MRKLIIVIMITVLFMACDDLTDNKGKDDPQSDVIRIGEVFTYEQISVKVVRAYRLQFRMVTGKP